VFKKNIYLQLKSPRLQDNLQGEHDKNNHLNKLNHVQRTLNLSIIRVVFVVESEVDEDEECVDYDQSDNHVVENFTV
jgi:hypothetical protein